jgi:hypothetical protein
MSRKPYLGHLFHVSDRMSSVDNRRELANLFLPYGMISIHNYPIRLEPGIEIGIFINVLFVCVFVWFFFYFFMISFFCFRVDSKQ